MEMSGIKAAIRKWQTFLHHSSFKIFTGHRLLTGKNIKEEKLLYEFAKINHLDFEIEYIQSNQHFRLPPNKQISNPLSKYTYRIQQISPEGSSFIIQDLKGRALEKKYPS